MTKASDNAYPSILVTEGTEPSAPAAGKQRLYIDSTTHHLMRVPSSGTEVDIEAGSSSAPSTADYLVGTANGSLSAEIVVGTTPGGELGGTWASPTIDHLHAGARHYFAHRLFGSPTNTNGTTDVNSTSYAEFANTDHYMDWDIFPATHFQLYCFGQSSTAGQTITCQLTPAASPTNPVSAGGDDLVISNTLGSFSSGWVAVSDSMSGLTLMTVALKGSNSTVDLAARAFEIAYKIQ